jgi:cell division septum initiation protein DivIVA
MTDFERSGERAGVTYDEPAKRRSPGTFFADLGDRLARGFSSFDRPQQKEPEWEPDEADWEPYEEEFDQPTEAVDPLPPAEPSRKRFPTALHGYDRDAVEDYIDGLEQELGQMAAKLSAQRQPTSTIEAELTRVGEETSAILRVAHEQAAEITKRARVEADRCIADAAANAVKMTEDAKRNLRQLDSETDAVWAERVRLIEDVRNVATSLFSLAEDACDRFPEDAERGAATISVSAMRPEPKAAPTPEPAAPPAAEQNPLPAPESGAAAPPPSDTPAPGTPPPATPAGAAAWPSAPPSPVAAPRPNAPDSPGASDNHAGAGGEASPDGSHR